MVMAEDGRVVAEDGRMVMAEDGRVVGVAEVGRDMGAETGREQAECGRVFAELGRDTGCRLPSWKPLAMITPRGPALRGLAGGVRLALAGRELAEPSLSARAA